MTTQDSLPKLSTPGVSGDESIKELFRNIHSMNKLLELFSAMAISLREISVNSAIATGHLGSCSNTVHEIAKQLDLASSRLFSLIRTAHTQTEKLSHNVLDCIVDSSLRNKFLQAEPLIEDAHNKESISMVSNKLSTYINERLNSAQQELAFLYI